MAIVVKSALDTTGIKEGTAAAQQQLKGDIGGALQSVQAKAQEAEKSLKGMLDLGKIQAAAGAFGAMKAIVDNAGKSVFGFSDATVKAAGSTLDMAAQGIAVGASFGPLGALVGGVAGALIGYISATEDATAATKELAAAEKERQEQLKIDAIVLDKAASLTEKFTALQREATLAISGDEFKLRGKSLDDLTDAYLDATDKIKDINKWSGESKAILDGLTGSQEANAAVVAIQENALENYADQLSEATRKQAAAQKAIDELTKSTQGNTAAIKENQEWVSAGVKGPTIKTTVDIDAIKKANADKIQAASEAFAAQEELNLGYEQAAQEHEERVASTRTRLALEAAEAQKAAIESVTQSMLDSSKLISDSMKNAFVTVGVGAANTLFANIEAKKPLLDGFGKAFDKIASEQLKAIGTTLIGQGLADELKAASLLITSLGTNPQGYALAGLGASEIAQGLLMGGAGALLGRRANAGATPTSTQTGSDSLGSRESEVSGPKQLGAVNVFLGPQNGVAVFADDQRGVSAYGKFTINAQNVAKKAPR